MIWLPKSYLDQHKVERDRLLRNAMIEAYHKNHSHCPACNGNSTERTCVGCAPGPGGEYRDTNQVWCSCGWTGIVDDLVGAKDDTGTSV